MLITPAVLQALGQGFNAAFSRGFGGVAPMYGQVAMTVPSTTSAENYGWMKDLPGMREWVGPRVIHNLEASTAQLKNKTYEHTIGVNVDDIEDDKLGIYTPMFAMQGEIAARHPDDLVWGLLRNGFSTAGFDGKPFFSANHEGFDEKGKAKAFNNLQTGNGNAWFLMDLSRNYMKPLIFQNRMGVQQVRKTAASDDNVVLENTYLFGCKARYNAGFGFHQLALGSKAALDATNYEAARLALATQRRVDGSPLGVGGTHLVCGPSNEGKARALLLRQSLAAGEDNIWYNSSQLIVCPWLD